MDLQVYLQTYYSARKANNPGFSYEAWNQELHFNKSRSFLRMIVIGKKKASPAFLEAFCRLNFATDHEAEYLHFMAKYSQASSVREKQTYGTKLIQMLRALPEDRTDISAGSDFVSSPLLPRLLTLVSLKDLTPTAASLAALLNLGTEEIEAALNVLQKLDLVVPFEHPAGVGWRSLSTKFKVPDDKGNPDLLKFHEISLQDAIKAYHLPTPLRKYKSLFLVMSDEDLTSLYEILDDFAAEQINRFHSDDGLGKRVFQLNFNVHAVSTPG